MLKHLRFATLWLTGLILVASCTSSEKQQQAQEEETPATARKIFDYVPPKPENGTAMGAVILGSSGFDAFRIEMDTARNWQLLEAQYGVSGVYENNAEMADIRVGLENYVKSFLDNGVSGDNIHFIVSSSAKENEKVQVIMRILDELGYVVNEVDEEMEARCAFYAAVPKDFQDKAFVVDVGSGNTKISWLQNDQVYSEYTYGSKYHLDNVSDSTAYVSALKASMSIPEASIDYAFVIGGAPYQLAKDIRIGEERYTTLKAPDQYPGITDQKSLNGLKLYEGIKFSTKCEQFIFDWHCNFAIGFLLLLGESEAEETTG